MPLGTAYMNLGGRALRIYAIPTSADEPKGTEILLLQLFYLQLVSTGLKTLNKSIIKPSISRFQTQVELGIDRIGDKISCLFLSPID